MLHTKVAPKILFQQATIENKTSVSTHSKKLTGNDVFIVSGII